MDLFNLIDRPNFHDPEGDISTMGVAATGGFSLPDPSIRFIDPAEQLPRKRQEAARWPLMYH